MGGTHSFWVVYTPLAGGVVRILHHPLQLIHFVVQLLVLPVALQQIDEPTRCLPSIFELVHDFLQHLSPLIVTLSRRCLPVTQLPKDRLALYVPALMLQPLQGIALHSSPQIPKTPPLSFHSSHIYVGSSFVLIGRIGYMRILAAMSLLRVGRALRAEPRNRIGLEFAPACQKILEETTTDDLFYGLNGEDSRAIHDLITEAFFNEGLRVDGLSDAYGLWNVQSIEVIVEELGVYFQIWFFEHIAVIKYLFQRKLNL